jgi:hypothetical protein
LIQGKTYKGSERLKCPICGDEVTRQGLGSHKRLKHNIRTTNKKKGQMNENEKSSGGFWAAINKSGEDMWKFFSGEDKVEDKKLDKVKKPTRKTQDED